MRIVLPGFFIRSGLGEWGMAIENQARFEEAIRRLDEANTADPREEVVDGIPRPRELLFAQRVYDWVLRLEPGASEELLLAARGHTLRRWMIPRDRYAKTTRAYHEWRDALAAFHAEEAGKILEGVGYEAGVVDRVRRLIARLDFPRDPDSQILEDADCLVFLQTKLHEYLDDWDEQKTIKILRRTIAKMTPAAQELAKQLALDDRSREILLKAL